MRHEQTIAVATSTRSSGRTFASFRPVETATTRAASLHGLPIVLEQRGVPLGPLLDAVGLPRTVLDDPEAPVDVAKAVRLLELAAGAADCPHLGLLCGQGIQPETLGIAGRLARNARDVGSALRGLSLNLHLNGHAFVPTLTLADDSAEFGLRLLPDLPGNTIPAIDVGMAAALTILRALCGPGWRPLDVLLVHRPPGGRQPYDRLFGVPVRFGSDRNSIVFAAAWLGRPVHGANAATRLLLERELALLVQRHRLPAAAMARRALIACIARGDMSVAAVSAAMGLNPRSLNRRLAREGTSVFDLMKEVRFQVARDLLASTALPITEIAETLLYSSIGAFTRAFRLWSGRSPSDWRQEQEAKRAPDVGPG